jgi:RNA polymerase sigma-70 factor (ECF subfamily)
MNDFETTYRENYPKMFRIAGKMVNDRDVASDIVQEVFVYYFEKLQNGMVVHHPQSWLVRAVMNKCVDDLNKRKKHTSLNEVSELATEEDNFEIRQRDAILYQAISELKPLEIKLIILYSEDYSYKEMAQITGINFSSVGKTLSRTLNKLKMILKRLNDEMY